MSKHTKGPWAIEFYEGEYLISGITDSEKHSTARCPHLVNATLVSACPDLLEALEGMYAIATSQVTPSLELMALTHNKARLAIAKAKGDVE